MTIKRFFKAASAAGLLTIALGACGSDIEDIQLVSSENELRGGKGKGNGGAECAIRCVAPPEGCTYEGAILTGPCHRVTCGELVCAPIEAECSLMCVAPAEGCHYEGALTTGPCSQVTCGTLVCDGTGL